MIYLKEIELSPPVLAEDLYYFLDKMFHSTEIRD